jgi:hypothetical protein
MIPLTIGCARVSKTRNENGPDYHRDTLTLPTPTTIPAIDGATLAAILERETEQQETGTVTKVRPRRVLETRHNETISLTF